MFALLKRRAVLVVLGLVLLALVIWFYGEVFFEVLEPATNRILAIVFLLLLFALWEMFRRMRAAQANNQLASAVVDQAKADRRPSADVAQLRERFEEALATLKQQKKRGGAGLYEMPWYVIIGAPGSGKTTALKYSGLKFPLEQRSGRGALRGVGGTRNCDWWFTEEAVLLDTAGRYTTQDSDASADSAGWSEFLTLLKKHRKRRPLNGVLLAISAQDLLTQGQAGREAHVAAARRRLTELNKELKIELPVYVLVTKCDLLAGFTEYFEDMSQEDRAQVLGVTFAKDVTLKGNPAAAFPEEFDAVLERLNQRLYARMEDERDVRRRARIFGFPLQLASLREGLADFIGEVFESTRFDQRVLLRGVYFTSGTQEGTPIDRLLGALGRRLAVPADAGLAPGKGKSYFIERVIKNVVLAESGLATASRRLELQKAVAQSGLYIGMLAAGLILGALLTNSYRINRRFLADFSTQVAAVRQTIPASGNSALGALPRLEALRTLIAYVDAYRASTWWPWRGWGLDQSDSIERSVRSVYTPELNQSLARTVRSRIEQRLESLIANHGDQLDLYLSLRAYLMLRDTKTSHFNPAEVRDIAAKEWAALYPGNEQDIRKLDDHFNTLLSSGLPPSDIREDLVARVRAEIHEDAAPRLILERLVRDYQSKHSTEPSLFEGVAIRTRQGRALDDGLPRLFTADGLRDADSLITEGEKQFRSEDWVWGEIKPQSRVDRREEIRQLYEQDYIKHWDGIIAAIGLPAAVGDALITLIDKVSNERTGLKQVLVVVDKHTYLVPPADEKSAPTLLGSAGAWLDSYGGWLRRELQGKKAELGVATTEHFWSIHGLVSPIGGKPPLVDELVGKMKDMGKGLQAAKPGVIGAPPPAAAAQELAIKAKDLQQTAAGLPGPAAGIGALISDLSIAAGKASGGQLEMSISNQFQGVVQQCRETITNRYPFYADAAEDVLFEDFKGLFGSEGAFARFVNDVLKDYVEDRGGTLVAKQLPGGGSLNIGAILNTLNSAARIRQAFFPGGQARVRFGVQVTDLDAYKFQLDDNLFEDGTALVEEGASPRPKMAVWPARQGPIRAQFTIDKMGGTRSVSGGDRAWAWFRLLDKGRIEREGEASFKVRLEAGDASATIRVTPESKMNPLTLIQNGSLRSFRCGG